MSLLVAPTLEGRTLAALCELAGITNRAPHTAAGDAAATAGAARWLLDQVDTTANSWALALRLLAEGGDGWPRLLPAPVLPSELSEAIAARSDPLTHPEAVTGSRGPVRQAVIEAFSRYGGSIEGYVDRPAQVEMASAVGDVLDSGGHLLVEAPTGTGKSLAYLVPAAWRAQSKGTPVVIATHTKVLQRQLRDDAQALRDVGLLGAPFRQIQGVSNYLCPRNLAEAIEAGGEGTNWHRWPSLCEPSPRHPTGCGTT